MRRNVFVRLLGLVLAVAVFSIAATAWLTTRGTSERLRGEFERTLEADSFVYQELLFYAQQHDSWDDVDDVVTDLAERTGRRVALTSPDGDILADSSGHDSPPLPSTPAAEIDPRAPQATVGEAIAPVGGIAYVWPIQTMAGWQLTSEEVASRMILAEEATACAQQIEGGAEVVVDATGSVLVISSGVVPPAPTKALVVLPCVREELHEPSAATVEINQREIELATACLDEAGVTYKTATDELGLISLFPGPQHDEAAMAEWTDCTAAAQAEAIEPFIADPALLYTGTTDRFDAFSGDGWTRVAFTGLAVLAAATGVTVLAGRRLTHPIRTLTAAAQRMGSGGRGARVAVKGHDEVARLGHAFNSMAESIESNERQSKAMVSDIAHELRTPLANVRGYLEAAEDGVVPLDPALVTS